MRRVDTRTSFTLSPSASFSFSSSALCSPSCACCAFFSSSPSILPRSRSPRATDASFLPVELGEAADQPFVHALGEQQHLDAALPEDLQVRAVLRRGEGFRGDVIDLVLPFLHAADIVGERNVLGFRIVEACDENRSSFAICSRFAGSSPTPFLQHAAEFAARTPRTCPCPSPRGPPAAPARASRSRRGSRPRPCSAAGSRARR